MRLRHLLAAAVVAVGSATVLAAPAYADDQLDQQFLQALRDRGVSVKSDGYALDLAHSTCDLLNNGGSVEQALRKIKTATKWSDQKAVDFGGMAVYAYCRDKLPQQQ
jgi:Protein of unknown function (DUF732)